MCIPAPVKGRVFYCILNAWSLTGGVSGILMVLKPWRVAKWHPLQVLVSWIYALRNIAVSLLMIALLTLSISGSIIEIEFTSYLSAL